MDRHKRMAQTLGCLVASMTVGAIVLQWGQPASAPTSPTQSVELIASSIRGHWQAIHIDTPNRPDGQIDPLRTHFYVDRAGLLSVSKTWRDQTRVDGKQVIRIVLQPPERSNQIAAPQWETTCRLRDVLIERCRIDTRDVTVKDTLVIPDRGAEDNDTNLKPKLAGAAAPMRSR